MTKHTPGPWRRGQEGNLRVYGPDATEHAGLIATVVRGVNADMIAAAPDMYGELQGVVNFLDHLVVHPDQELVLVRQSIRMVLAKARGES